MQSTQSGLLTLQQQITGGIALISVGNNPSAFGQMAQLQQTQGANDQYQSSHGTTDTRLTSMSSALTNLVTTLQQGKRILVGANTSLMAEPRRVSMLVQVKQQYQQLLSTVNQRDAASVALFGGISSTTDPFANTGGSVQYVGDGRPPVAQVSQDISMPSSVSGDSMFVRIPNPDASSPNASRSIFKTCEKLITALSTPINTATQVTDIASLQKAVQTAQDNSDNTYQVALQVQVTVGTQRAQLATLNSSGSNYGEQLKEQISKLQSVDYTSAISQFSQQQISLQAAQKTFTVIQGMSLFQYINP